jgi:hypothetical protein
MAQTTITLADYIQSPRVPTLTKGVVNIMRDESPLINKLSFNTSKYLRRRNYRGQTSMNEVTWKDLGENFDTVLQGIGDLVEESIYWFGGEIPVAKVLLEASDEVIEEPVTSTIELTTRSNHTSQFAIHLSWHFFLQLEKFRWNQRAYVKIAGCPVHLCRWVR